MSSTPLTSCDGRILDQIRQHITESYEDARRQYEATRRQYEAGRRRYKPARQASTSPFVTKIMDRFDEIMEQHQRFQASYTCQNMASPNFGDEQAVSVPTSVEELGIPVELAEQAVEENPVSVSPASESCQNMAPPSFGGEQADSVPASVEQLGTLPTLKHHVLCSAMHMAPAKSPANVVPSLAAAMIDFRNLQYRRHVKHLVDYTDVASMGGNTINMSAYAYSS